MWRGRRVLSIALLLVLLGAGGGYRLTHGDGPSPVLRTIDVGDRVVDFTFDATLSRLYLGTGGSGVQMVDTRRGSVQQPAFLSQLLSPPEITDRSPHLITHEQSSPMLLDRATGTLLRPVALPEGDVQGYYVDRPDQRVYYNYQRSATISIVDLWTGAVLHNAQACLSPVASVASAVGGRPVPRPPLQSSVGPELLHQSERLSPFAKLF